MSTSTKSYAAQTATSPIAPHTIERRDPLPSDVQIEILFCGVCHSDLHQARDEWHFSTFPVVPGHEIVGRVTAVGSAVTKFRQGDLAAVGCLVDSCRTCSSCARDLEQYCIHGATQTYNTPDKISGGSTYGGYSESIVVDEAFVLSVPTNLDLAAVAPLLCAGITTYSPLKHWNIKKGMKVGIVGLGGLGHMGVKFAHAFGAHTVVLTTSKSKVEDALRLGADEVILSSDPEQMKQHAGTFDFILDCVSADHDINAYLALLAVDGTMTLVGAPEDAMPVAAFALLTNRRSFAGSGIGGLKETQEMLDFCAEHNIVSDIEMIRMDQINEAYDRLLKSDVKYRFVIDMATLKS
jgi:uncharacterized zinc-type alcohol dehydrogenase-like protein